MHVMPALVGASLELHRGLYLRIFLLQLGLCLVAAFAWQAWWVVNPGGYGDAAASAAWLTKAELLWLLALVGFLSMEGERAAKSSGLVALWRTAPVSRTALDVSSLLGQLPRVLVLQLTFMAVLLWVDVSLGGVPVRVAYLWPWVSTLLALPLLVYGAVLARWVRYATLRTVLLGAGAILYWAGLSRILDFGF